jgi:mRNA interferase MazF
MLRGEVWWAALGAPRGSEPAFRRPVLVVQSDVYNRSKIGTVMVAALTSNVRRGEAPGNVRLSKGTANLPRTSIVNVAHVMTVNREDLVERLGILTLDKMRQVDAGLRLALDLAVG